MGSEMLCVEEASVLEVVVECWWIGDREGDIKV